MKIAFDEITFVIQGLVCAAVNQSIELIRRHFPGATVIVSTCNEIGIDIAGADLVLQSDDPGALYYYKKKGATLNNINRQVRSTLVGLQHTKTKYAFKLRSDFLITGTAFLDYLNRFTESDESYRIFQSKVLACCYFSRNPESYDNFPFHISDLAFFGETSQLIDLFDIPLLSDDDAYQLRVIDEERIIVSQYWPEQYLMLSWLHKNNRQIHCENFNDATPKNCEQTARYFASNFILLEFSQFCLQPTKDVFSLRLHPRSFISCYTHIEWQRLYQEYVDAAHRPPRKDPERIEIERQLPLRRERLLANICAAAFLNSQTRKRVRRRVLAALLDQRVDG